MPKKKIIHELDSDPPVLFPPEEVYYREGEVLLLARGLEEWPTIAPHKNSIATVRHILEAWMEDNELKESTLDEWYECIDPIRGILELSGDDRKKFFKIFKSTRQRKINDAIKILREVQESLQIIDSKIWNDLIRLDYLHEPIDQELLPLIEDKLEEYKTLQVLLKHTGTGDHSLLEARLRPLIANMAHHRLNKDQQARALCGLLQRFEYEPFNLFTYRKSRPHARHLISKTTKPSLMIEREKAFVTKAKLIISKSLTMH